ncbi:aldehyde dehydrogenase family protein [Aquirufa rosea]|uniref:Acyl-CoA reductase n=1 Tax=Aquirufa rosea TaxID=2509241 RepID=A0A4Q1C256_9BACT|nr:acyl-CoA reductase [Aquirufa rosea]RXK52334.1 acyl-CoA reductase [Aquirufa rosea]
MKKDSFLQLIGFLHDYFTKSSNKEKIELFIEKAKDENPWFSDHLIREAMDAIQIQFFDINAWEVFFQEHPEHVKASKKVGLILAGNLPAVGLHDVLMTLASGNTALVKLSSQDKSIMQLYIQVMQSFSSDVPVQLVDRLQGAEAVIATGSDFSSSYFSHYFASMPHIIRKNRTSIALLTGNESKQDFEGLAKDIFSYYGLGCRNVSTIAIPESFDPTPLFDVLTTYHGVLDHNKYSNNYQYHKTLFLLNQVQHFDLGNLLVLERDELVSPVGVIFLKRYSSLDELNAWIQAHEHKIQCVVSQEKTASNRVYFGESQQPGLSDFADGIDTYAFLSNLS